MSSFKFGQIKIASKGFNMQREKNDIFTLDIIVSDKVSCSNGKSCRYIVGYHVDGEAIIRLFIKTKNIYLAILAEIYFAATRTIQII